MHHNAHIHATHIARSRKKTHILHIEQDKKRDEKSNNATYGLPRSVAFDLGDDCGPSAAPARVLFLALLLPFLGTPPDDPRKAFASAAAFVFTRGVP